MRKHREAARQRRGSGGGALLSFLLALAVMVEGLSASFCGSYGVPFSLEIMADGLPVLGCAQPSCIAEPPTDYDDSSFITDENGHTDGFLRKRAKRISYLENAKPQAVCSGEFNRFHCTRRNEWVAGIEHIDHPRQAMMLQCCTFEGLRFSQDVGVTTIQAGEAVTGGEVVRDGRQISFDVIANVKKLVDDNRNGVSYEVTVRRMNCLPDPPELEISYDIDVDEEIYRVLGHAINGSAPIGHDGHPHKDLENFHRKRNHQHFKRKPNKYQSSERLSYGAPIFNPQRNRNRLPPAPLEESNEFQQPEVITRRPPKLRRKVLTPRPHRQILVTPPPIQVEPPTAPPIVTTLAPTLPPFTMPTLPTLPTLPPLFNPFMPPPQSPFLSFGVPQAQTQAVQTPGLFGFGLQAPPPSPISPYGLTPGNIYGPTSYGLAPASLFGVQQQQSPNPLMQAPFIQHQTQPIQQPQSVIQPQQTAPRQYAVTNYAPPQQNQYNPQQQQQQFQRKPKPVVPIMRTNNARYQPGMDEKPEIVEPHLAPKNQQLGTIYQPPAFSSLPGTLNNFQFGG